MDIGHLSQTFHLAVSVYGLYSWTTGEFFDDKVSKFLKANETEHPLLFIGAGIGNGNTFPKNI